MTIAVFLENRPFFGAVLTHIPFLHALRLRYREARIVAFAPFAEAGMLVRCGCADEARLYRRGILGLRRELRALAPDAVYLLRPRSQWLEIAVGISGAPVRVGFRSILTRPLFTRTVPHRTDVYRPRKYLALLPEEDRHDLRGLSLDPWFREAVAVCSRDGAPTGPRHSEGPARARALAVLPGGGAGAFKLWGIENFIALCSRIGAEDPDLRFLFVLGAGEAGYRRQVEASEISARAGFLIDRTLAELAAGAFQAIAAVGNDCGPGHLFQMCGCPFVCIMSNHDGRAAGRIAEWVDEPNRRYVLTTPPGKRITQVTVEAACEALLGLMREV